MLQTQLVYTSSPNNTHRRLLATGTKCCHSVKEKLMVRVRARLLVAYANIAHCICSKLVVNELNDNCK